MIKSSFTVTGMHCAMCSGKVESTVSGMDGVKKASVNLATSKLTVQFDEKITSENAICMAVKGLGFGINSDSFTDNYEKRVKGVKNMRTRFILSLIFTLPLFYISMGTMVGLPVPNFIDPNVNPFGFAYAQALLAIGSMVVGYKFYTVGYKNLFTLSPNMDSLVAVGTTSAFVYGVYNIVLMYLNPAHAFHLVHNLYFESAGVIITLILLGRFLENRSKLKTNDAIKKLIELTPKKALIEVDGKQIEVDVEDIKDGDIVIISPGDKISVDGDVIEGASSVDESMLTGESIGVEKTVNSKVYAGSINKYGYLKVKAKNVGNTLLSQIIKMVEEASGSKPEIAKLADKIASVFVPTVMGIAVITAISWIISGADAHTVINAFISVMVIACPCALGLATPTAVIVAVGKGAELGVLVKDSNALELLNKVNTVVFDKTGTLTTGNIEVTDVLCVEGITEDELLSCVYSAEKMSEHPLSDALVSYAKLKNACEKSVESFEAIVGHGVSAIVDGKKILIGNAKLMHDNAIELNFEEELETLSKEGKTSVLVAVDSTVVGCIAMRDSIKTDSKETISALNTLGKKTVLLTGDNKYVANAIANELGVSDVVSEVLPNDKANKIKEFKSTGDRVAMVGDGINDSVALVTADVGLAVSGGTEIAIESADIVILNDRIKDILKAIKLSKITITNIKQNLFFAFIYNIILIPVAAFNNLNPMIAALAMSLSSVSVVTNALRIKIKKI